ncbi:hypothetical protein PTMSG1_06194 [Pyrenophora teres f. maculata]|nr:hypothetical protein PTMSG1_06194 [Pyrenophora teres f. maculata]
MSKLADMAERHQAALIASVVSGAFSWPMVDEAPWTAKASFYSTLFISLSAVAAGAQQSIALDRYGQHPEGIRQLQELLRGGSSGSVSWLQLNFDSHMGAGSA